MADEVFPARGRIDFELASQLQIRKERRPRQRIRLLLARVWSFLGVWHAVETLKFLWATNRSIHFVSVCLYYLGKNQVCFSCNCAISIKKGRGNAIPHPFSEQKSGTQQGLRIGDRERRNHEGNFWPCSVAGGSRQEAGGPAAGSAHTGLGRTDKPGWLAKGAQSQ